VTHPSSNKTTISAVLIVTISGRLALLSLYDLNNTEAREGLLCFWALISIGAEVLLTAIFTGVWEGDGGVG